MYLKSDVLQLTDVFENFRSVCLENYSLNPAHYYTAPGLPWDAMLLYTKVELELITDVNMYSMVENGIRGGISMISQKFAMANNPYLEDYDPEQPNSDIMYLDANNVCGWAMSQCLLTSKFAWVPLDAWSSSMSWPSTKRLTRATFWKSTSIIQRLYAISTVII